jgi:hypothetical protein
MEAHAFARKSVENLHYELTLTWVRHIKPCRLEIWKGDADSAPYHESYLEDPDRIIAHTHPSSGQGLAPYFPPSPADLINTADAVVGQQHWVLCEGGVWVYSTGQDMRAVRKEHGENKWRTAAEHNICYQLSLFQDPYVHALNLSRLIPITGSSRRVGFDVTFLTWDQACDTLEWPRLLISANTFAKIDLTPTHHVAISIEAEDDGLDTP